MGPVGTVQTVTVTAVTSSPYGTTQFGTAQQTFDVTYRNPCLDPSNFEIVNPGQTSFDVSDTYTGTPMVFNYDPITVNPPACTLTTSCNNVDSGELPCNEIGINNQASWTVPESAY